MPESDVAPPLGRSLVWYLVIGGAKTLGSYGLYALLVMMLVHPQVALVISHVVVTVLGYRGHAQFSFGVRGWSGFWRYFIIMNGVYVTNAGLLAFLIHWGVGPLVAQALCQPVTIALGFIVTRRYLRPSSVSPASSVASSSNPG